MKKKIVTICLVAAIAVMAIAGASLAYFTDRDEKTNVFTVGNVDITLVESKWDENKVGNVVPGYTYDKDPVVNNVGSTDAWVRVDVTLSNAAAFKAAAATHGIADLSSIFTIDNETKVTEATFDSTWKLAGKVEDASADTITYSYYYKTVLKAGENTGALFTAVTIPASFTSDDMASVYNGTDHEFTIKVTAHAIQTAPSYTTVEDAFAAYANN